MRVSSSSPAACPNESLTCLKPSRSSSRSAPGAPVAARAADLALELLLEAPAAEEPGQRVAVGELLQLVLEALALGDVDRLQDDQPLAIGAVREARRRQRADVVSVAVLEAQLARRPGGRRARRRASAARVERSSGCTIDAPTRAEQLRGLPAEHAREGRVALDDLDAAVVVDAADEHADGRRGERRLEERARRGQLARRPARGRSRRATRRRPRRSRSSGVADGELQRPEVARLAGARIRGGLRRSSAPRRCSMHLAIVGRRCARLRRTRASRPACGRASSLGATCRESRRSRGWSRSSAARGRAGRSPSGCGRESPGTARSLGELRVRLASSASAALLRRDVARRHRGGDDAARCARTGLKVDS